MSRVAQKKQNKKNQTHKDSAKDYFYLCKKNNLLNLILFIYSAIYHRMLLMLIVTEIL